MIECVGEVWVNPRHVVSVVIEDANVIIVTVTKGMYVTVQKIAVVIAMVAEVNR